MFPGDIGKDIKRNFSISGDTLAWDHQIRQQIHDCRLFLALISAHTEARDEGYFRREWRLAVERAGDMAEKKAFLVPVVIDHSAPRGTIRFHTTIADGTSVVRTLVWARMK